MDQLPLQQEPEQGVFPNGPCVRTRVYVTQTPFSNEDGTIHTMVVMDYRDWVEHGTLLETLRRVAKSQDAKIRELHADIGARDKRHADLLDRMEALREIRRAEKRVEIGVAINMPEISDVPISFKPKGT